MTSNSQTICDSIKQLIEQHKNQCKFSVTLPFWSSQQGFIEGPKGYMGCDGINPINPSPQTIYKAKIESMNEQERRASCVKYNKVFRVNITTTDEKLSQDLQAALTQYQNTIISGYTMDKEKPFKFDHSSNRYSNFNPEFESDQKALEQCNDEIYELSEAIEQRLKLIQIQHANFYLKRFLNNNPNCEQYRKLAREDYDESLSKCFELEGDYSDGETPEEIDKILTCNINFHAPTISTPDFWNDQGITYTCSLYMVRDRVPLLQYFLDSGIIHDNLAEYELKFVSVE